METRFKLQRRFADPSKQCLEITHYAYRMCLHAAFKPEIRSQIDAINLEESYLELMAHQLNMGDADQLLYKAMKSEYPSASSERKWEIFKCFRHNKWGDPYEEE